VILVAQISKSSQIREVIQEVEDSTKEVEVEEEAGRLSIDVTNVTGWVTDLLNVLKRRMQNQEVHM
jgi:hypothetical protein